MNISGPHFAFLMFSRPSTYVIKDVDVLGINLGTEDIVVKQTHRVLGQNLLKTWDVFPLKFLLSLSSLLSKIIIQLSFTYAWGITIIYYLDFDPPSKLPQFLYWAFNLIFYLKASLDLKHGIQSLDLVFRYSWHYWLTSSLLWVHWCALFYLTIFSTCLKLLFMLYINNKKYYLYIA